MGLRAVSEWVYEQTTDKISRLSEYSRMQHITRAEYLQYLGSHDSVSIENARIRFLKAWMIERFEPSEFIPEQRTIWSFPNRGDWATHIGDYHGNWSPFIPRNLIHKFTAPGDLVCDPMVGSGTTLVECKLMARRGIGVDINLNAGMVAMNRLDFESGNYGQRVVDSGIEVFRGDARNLNEIEDEVVDLVATHPPYCDTISYSREPGDLSSLSLEDFTQEMGRVAEECLRVLKPNKYCGILIGDTRKHLHYVPIHIGVLGRFLEAGFVLKEDIIKLQHNTTSARESWTGQLYDFYKIAHEHLYLFRKPMKGENMAEMKYSKKWW